MPSLAERIPLWHRPPVDAPHTTAEPLFDLNDDVEAVESIKQLLWL
jgi:hypothetical protein